MLDKLLALLKLIQVIVPIVHIAEAAIPGAGQGSHKLDLILNTVNAAAAATPDVASAISREDISASVTAITNAAVTTLNAAGVFQKSK